MQLKFLFRKPKFPVICDFDNTVVSFISAPDMVKKIMNYQLREEEQYDLIDVTGNSFTVYFYKDIAISPFNLERWTKRRLIDLVNNRSNKKDDSLYVLKNVNTRKIDVLIRDLADFLNKSDKKETKMKSKQKIITREDVNKLFKKLQKDKGGFLDSLESGMASEQPAVYDFFVSFDTLTDDDHDYCMDAVVMAWYIVADKLGKNWEISPDFINEQYHRNVQYHCDGMEQIADEPYRARSLFYHRNNQPELMDFFIDMVFSQTDANNRADVPLSVGAVPVILICVKTVVDCLVLDEAEELAETCDREYSDSVQGSVKKTIKQYYNEFRKSPYYMKLSHDAKTESGPVVTCFGEMMYSYFLMHPLHWNARRSVQCAVNIMPAKVVSDDVFFESIEPVLTAFMLFCAEKGYVNDSRYIAARLDGITRDILDEAADDKHWGLGKSLVEDAAK